MLKNIFYIIVFSFISQLAYADEAADKAEFKTLYAQFKDLYTNSEAIDPIIVVAEKLYKLVPKVYGKNSKTHGVITYNLASLYLEKSASAHNPEREDRTTVLFEKYFNILDKNNAAKDRVYVNQYLTYLKASVDDHTEKSIKKQAKKIHLIAIDNNYELYELAQIENSIALLLFKNKQYLSAKTFFENANKNFVQAYGPDHFKVGETFFAIAKLEMGWKKREKAENLFLKALNIFEKNGELGNALSQSSHAFLVNLYEDMGQSDKATKHCQAVAIERPKDFDLYINPLYRLPPKYPNFAAENGREGYVILEFTVDEDGITREIQIVESSNKIFEKESIKAAENFRFAPSVKDGKLIPTLGVRNRIIFQMAN